MPLEHPTFRADDGFSVPYVDLGTGAPLVYLFGFGETLASNRATLAQFAENFRVLAFERRGSGVAPFDESTSLSEVEAQTGVERLASDLRNLLETLDLRDATIVGYSMGGTVLFSYLRRFGTDRIARVVFVDATPKLANDADWTLGLWQGRYSQADLNRDLESIENDLPRFRLSFFLRASTQTRPDDAPLAFPDDRDGLFERAVEATGIRSGLLKRVFFAEHSPAEKRADRVYWETMARADFRDVLPKINVPSLVVFAEPGSFYSLKTAQFTANALPNATLAPIPDASHASFAKEKATEFVRAVVDFYSKNN